MIIRKPCLVLAAFEPEENTIKRIRNKMRKEIDGDINYPHLVKIIKGFEEIRLVNSRKEGRHIVFTLTEKGSLVKREIDNLINLIKDISLQGGARDKK